MCMEEGRVVMSAGVTLAIRSQQLSAVVISIMTVAVSSRRSCTRTIIGGKVCIVEEEGSEVQVGWLFGWLQRE